MLNKILTFIVVGSSGIFILIMLFAISLLTGGYFIMPVLIGIFIVWMLHLFIQDMKAGDKMWAEAAIRRKKKEKEKEIK